MECSEAYREAVPERLKPLGETEFVAKFARADAYGPAGKHGACKGIIGRAGLMEGASVEDVLLKHQVLGQGLWRDIRNSIVYDETNTVRTTARTPPPSVLMDDVFRQGFEKLVSLGMSFDCWLYHTQLDEVADLAQTDPAANIILDHVGGPIGAGAYAGKRKEAANIWKTGFGVVALH